MAIQNLKSLITERYPYAEVKRKKVDGKRYYEGQNKLLPSVTTILSASKSEEDKKGLDAWRNRVGEETAEAIRNQAASIGTAVHKFLECTIKGVGYDDITNNGVIGKRMAKVIIDKAFSSIDEFWGTEVALYYPTLYGGRPTVWVYGTVDRRSWTSSRRINRRKQSGLKTILSNWRLIPWRTMRCLGLKWRWA